MTISGSALGRAARVVWYGAGPWEALARGLLVLPSLGYRAAVAARNAAYDLGWVAARPLPAPSIGVGNLAVGGAGKTPLVRFFADGLARRGCHVGILARGYGNDEILELREALPGAVVVPDADRHRGAREALRLGAGALVLDDCLQRRDVAPDVMVAVVASETADAARWRLPAGPWREGLAALERADVVVVTRKAAPPERAARLADQLAPRTRRGEGVVVSFALARLRPLAGGDSAAPGRVLAGQRVVAACGIGAPEAFATQLRALGAARVDLAAFGDHHSFSRGDVASVRAGAGAGGLVVTTAKDATKLRALWPAEPPNCWVAELDASVERGDAVLERLLDGVAGWCREAHAGAPATKGGWP